MKHTHTHTHTHIHTQTHTHTNTHTHKRTYTHKHTHTQTHIHSQTHTHTQTHMHTQTNTHTHIHTETHTRNTRMINHRANRTNSNFWHRSLFRTYIPRLSAEAHSHPVHLDSSFLYYTWFRVMVGQAPCPSG